jgi:hypothetical protein
MRKLLLTGFLIVFLSVSCRERNRETMEQDSSEATMASEIGTDIPRAADVMLVTQPLIGGELYTSPDFKSTALAQFDTAQHIHVIDTTHPIFVRARIKKENTTLTGYIPKTILPDKKK